jgi:hypothetical protein
MNTENEYLLRVSSRAFCCGVTIRNGRVDLTGTAPYLRRLKDMTAEAFMEHARARGWKVERAKTP